MTSSSIDGIKRSNVCGDGYRIEGALLKSYPYTQQQSYLPYENCYMTFKVRFNWNDRWENVEHKFLLGSSSGLSNTNSYFISRSE